MKLRFSSIILCFIMLSVLLTGCATKAQEPATSDNPQVSTQPSDVSKSNSDTSEDTKKQPKEKKKIVVVQESGDELRTEIQQNIIKALADAGYTKDTADITEINMEGDEKKSQEVADKVKSLNPDVAIINNSLFAYKTVAKMLKGAGFPVVLNNNIEQKAQGFISDDGKPTDNVTGIYSLPKDAQLNAFQLLNTISPANGKKAVFVTVDGRFNKEDIEKNLKAINVELKDYCESKYVEDFKASITKYNDDNEVAWILIGVWPSTLKDGTPVSNLDTGKWDIANRKKPSVTYFETAVKMGIPVGIAIDQSQTGFQVAKMAVKILEGTKVTDLVAEYPEKTNIVLNKKSADNLKMVFPPEVLSGAGKVYTTTVNDPDYK
jgi:ABC-type uncharacterized transport system substrate-binding protein